MKFTFAPESRPLEGYTIKRAIYRGGFGEVYYGLTDAGREVALKLLQNNTEVELRGVQQCLNLSHPNLVTIFDVKTDRDGDHWIVMEYVAGETLDAAVHRHPEGMPVERVRQWLDGMTAGVQFLHDRGIVHRDLKPGNVFSADQIVKIGDVGLSKFITPSRRSAQTQSVGTVYYMAPEVAKGRYGLEVDVYALGIMLYEMLTGRVPFDGESTGEILMKHLSAKPDLTKLPPRLQPVIGRALEKDPAERYASVTQLKEAFDQAVIGKTRGAEAPQPSWRETPSAATVNTFPAGAHRGSGATVPAHPASYDFSTLVPTYRAVWLCLAAGVAAMFLFDERGEDAMAVATFTSWLAYFGYVAMRQVDHPRGQRLLRRIDADSLRVNALKNPWWLMGPAAFVLWAWPGFARANTGDVFEVVVPISLLMVMLGGIGSMVIPFFRGAFETAGGRTPSGDGSAADENWRTRAPRPFP